MLGSNLLLVALAAVAAHAGSLDITQEVRRGFGAGVVYPRQSADSSTNLQSFTGALGGIKASAITNSGDTQRPFEVDGDTFTDFQSAANRACDNQHNACAELSNNGTADFPVSDCDQQTTECKSAATSSTETAFTSLVSSNADFDFFCES
ncbi:putative neurofilament medium polypeptide protein [Phaeoacremonium minimum UCRPA7]|uniref:Putative neurofilament medium polypeptide protein n=1 Tax=Phaeoacremonium minimum (strain UCR-PA7) TaxID=1286976 RepID=R8BI02_PHAM7|nr:putative neurofilament medium polypeptide protein [Phaeoacremonium minimum UCRPA7]EON98970.1 putative neurofilament medium polypeptide protein [Phaeoacremonium minimum UCRPA7]